MTRLRSKVSFNRKLAIRMFHTEYYRAQAQNIKTYEFIEKEKGRLSTPRAETVSNIIEHSLNKGLLEGWTSPTARILKGIYEKNKKAVLENREAQTDNLTKILAKPELLMLAYRSIKGNKGAMTKGAEFDPAK